MGLGHRDFIAWVGSYSAGIPRGKSFNGLLSQAELVNEELGLLWVGCGKSDFLFERLTKFFERLKTENVIHIAHISEGGHEWRVWRRYLNEFLPLLFKGREY